MKNFFFFAALATCAIAAACNRNTAPEVVTSSNGGNDEITFETKGLIAEVDLKSVTETKSLTQFNVAATVDGKSSEEYAWASPHYVLFSKQSGSSSFAGNKFWPKDDPKFHFYASNIALNCTAGTMPTVTANNTTDVVCAYLANPSYKTSNTLIFKHIFARLGTVTIAAPDQGYSLKSVEVTLTPIKGGTYNIKDGYGKTDATGWSDTSTGTKLTIASAQGTNAASDEYLVPGKYDLTATYTLKKDLYEESFTKTGTVDIQGGKINNISASLPTPESSAGAVDIIFTVSVATWEKADVNASF